MFSWAFVGLAQQLDIVSLSVHSDKDGVKRRFGDEILTKKIWRYRIFFIYIFRAHDPGIEGDIFK